MIRYWYYQLLLFMLWNHMSRIVWVQLKSLSSLMDRPLGGPSFGGLPDYVKGQHFDSSFGAWRCNFTSPCWLVVFRPGQIELRFETQFEWSEFISDLIFKIGLFESGPKSELIRIKSYPNPKFLQSCLFLHDKFIGLKIGLAKVNPNWSSPDQNRTRNVT